MRQWQLHPAEPSIQADRRSSTSGDNSGAKILQLVEVEEPVAGPGQVLVRLRAVSLNYRDLLMRAPGHEPRVCL